MLRLDTIGLYEGGNKLFKLKYNLEQAKKQGFEKILTYLRRRNRSSEAPPKAAKASVPGSGTGTKPKEKLPKILGTCELGVVPNSFGVGSDGDPPPGSALPYADIP